MEGTIAVFIPIIFIVVIGLVVAVALQLKSKEKQMMLEKGLSPEQMVELLKAKERDSKNGYYLLKGGIILIFLVIGGIIGNMIDRAFFYTYEGGHFYHEDPVYGVWIAFLGLGIGAVAAHFIARKVEIAEEKRNEIK
jgi:hypothetical protein